MAPLSDKFYSARVVDRRDLSDDLWVIRVDPGGEFRFDPGQYATLGVVDQQGHHERAYSIVSAPHEKQVEFFIELVPKGELTPLLYPLKPGGELTMRKTAKGRFKLESAGPRTNHLLLATVTGIAPFVSYVRSLHKQWKEGSFSGGHKLFLIQGGSRSWEFGYREEMERIAGEVPWFKYVPTISRPWEDPAWKGETGRVDDLIRKYTDSWGMTPETTAAYLCGHPSMIENGKGILQRRGWKKESMKEEVYFIPAKDSAAS